MEEAKPLAKGTSLMKVHPATMEAVDLQAGTDLDPQVIAAMVEAMTAAVTTTVMKRKNRDTTGIATEIPSSCNPQKSSTPQAEYPSDNGYSRQTSGSTLQESEIKTESLKPHSYSKDMHSLGG